MEQDMNSLKYVINLIYFLCRNLEYSRNKSRVVDVIRNTIVSKIDSLLCR